MKKNNSKKSFIIANIGERRYKNRVKRNLLKKFRNRVRQFIYAIRVIAPKTIMLRAQSTHFEVTSFLEDFRKKITKSERSVIVDFTKTEMIYPGAGLLMYAEIQRAIGLYPRVKFYCRESRSDRVNQVLQHLKIFKMLNYESTAVPSRSDVVSWRHASENIVNVDKAGQIIESYDSLSKPISKLLFKAAVEAITNAVMHAYDKPRNDGLRVNLAKSWWMFCREDDEHFYMSVCDLGVGIPKTLTAKNAPEIIDKILEKITLGKRPGDSQMILGAMEYARTRTMKPNQGKGLMDIKKIIEQEQLGYMSVYSNRGCVKFDPVNGYQQFSYDNSIRGTLIVWSLPLKNKADENG